MLSARYLSTCSLTVSRLHELQRTSQHKSSQNSFHTTHRPSKVPTVPIRIQSAASWEQSNYLHNERTISNTAYVKRPPAPPAVSLRSRLGLVSRGVRILEICICRLSEFTRFASADNLQAQIFLFMSADYPQIPHPWSVNAYS